jgi:hypothetical protein
VTLRRWVVVALAVLPLTFLGCVGLVLGGGAGGHGGSPSAEAVADIPAEFLALYERAAGIYGLDWAVLAGIGKVECDHGRSQLAGCNPPGTINGAGARGPMQFLGATWRAGADTFALDVAGPPTAPGAEGRGYATDGDGDGVADPWVPADAIVAAARLIAANGAPSDYSGALWAYNHSASYRDTVLGWADTYRAAGAAGAPPSAVVGGPVSLSTVGGITVNSAIAAQVQQLLAAAAADGVTLRGSGYRDPDQQIALRREHCGTSNFAIYRMPASQCSPPTARPGTSMHERGLAIDFTACSSGSACFVWLSAHAAACGLFNLPGEPWHWSIDGS